jgi:hypothetical protein
VLTPDETDANKIKEKLNKFQGNVSQKENTTQIHSLLIRLIVLQMMALQAKNIFEHFLTCVFLM